jgi:hypothetical protein
LAGSQIFDGAFDVVPLKHPERDVVAAAREVEAQDEDTRGNEDRDQKQTLQLARCCAVEVADAAGVGMFERWGVGGADNVQTARISELDRLPDGFSIGTGPRSVADIRGNEFSNPTGDCRK